MIVLDAAALVDVVLDQATKPWVLEQLVGQPIMAPAHQPAEILSALARLVRSGDLSADVATRALAEAGALEQELVVPPAAHLARALDLQDRIRVLDALYVVLAQDHDATLVTTDRRLARSAVPVMVVAPD